MNLILATSNQGKVKEFQNLLVGYQIETLSTPLSVPETANTYYENCLMKALRYFDACKKPVIADDSGLEVAILKGELGVHTATFGGENTPWETRWNLLYEELRTFPKKLWQAEFRSVVCYYDGKKPPVFFEGITKGEISELPRGKEGFGYDPVFFYAPLNKTFGQLTLEEKNEVSHRAKAIKNLKAYLDLNRSTG